MKRKEKGIFSDQFYMLVPRERDEQRLRQDMEDIGVHRPPEVPASKIHDFDKTEKGRTNALTSGSDANAESER